MNKNPVLLMVVLIVALCLALACLAVVVLMMMNAAPAPGYVVTPPTSATSATPAVNVPAPPTMLTLGAAPVIHLAGRTDIVIPALDETSESPLFGCRPMGLVQETYPPGYRVSAGARLTARAEGRVNYYGGAPEEGYPPDGDPNYPADIEPFGGISGYTGPAGALVGVFLDDAIPNGTAPDRLDFNESGLGVDFTTLEPALGQVFFIGDGVTRAGQTQTFIAPAGATRLFIGLIDGSGFYGASTCYTDNTGGFTYRLQATPPLAPLP